MIFKHCSILPVSLLPFIFFHQIVATLINTALAISMPTVVCLDQYLPQDPLFGVMAKKPLGKFPYYLHWLYTAFFHLSTKISILLVSRKKLFSLFSSFSLQFLSKFKYVSSFLKPMSMNQSSPVRRTDPKPFCQSTTWVLKKAAITKCLKIPRLDRLLQCLMLFKLQQLMHTLGKSIWSKNKYVLFLCIGKLSSKIQAWLWIRP